jgi:hypothetical protein
MCWRNGLLARAGCCDEVLVVVEEWRRLLAPRGAPQPLLHRATCYEVSAVAGPLHLRAAFSRVVHVFVHVCVALTFVTYCHGSVHVLGVSVC